MYTQENNKKRFAFYLAGKCLVQTLLFHHPKLSILKITEPSNQILSFSPDFSLVKILSLLNKKAKLNSNLLTTIDLETLLIGLYAGKAGEFFNNYTKKKKETSLIKSLTKTKAVHGRTKTSRGVQKAPPGAPVRFCNRRGFLLCPCTAFCSPPLLFGSAFARLFAKPLLSSQKNRIIFGLLKQTNKVPKQNFVALHRSQLKDEHYYSVLSPLKHFVFTNRLNCTKINHLLYQSDTGSLERIKANYLAKHLIIDQSIHSPNFFNLQKNCQIGNLNKTEISDSKVFDLFNNFQKKITGIFLKENNRFNLVLQDNSLSDLNVYPIPFSKKNKFVTKKKDLFSQKKEISAWCEKKVCKALMFSNKSYGHWFRIYLPQIETHQRQPVSQDQFFKIRSELELFMYALGNVSYTHMPAFSILDLPNNKGKTDKKPQFVKKTKLDLSIVNKAVNAKSVAYTNFVCAKAGLNKNKGLAKSLAKTKFLHAQECTYQSKNPVVQKFPLLHGLSEAEFLHCYTPLQLIQKIERDSIVKHSFKKECDFEVRLLPQEFGYETSHNFIVNTFSQALNIIGQNRELLDILTDHLIRFEKIRVPEILRICVLYTDDNSLI